MSELLEKHHGIGTVILLDEYDVPLENAWQAGFYQEMIRAYGLESKAGEVREWYAGYLFGNDEIYNPWSVTKYVHEHRSMPDAFPEPYWSNTSSNSVVRELALRASGKGRGELETLIQGGTIEKRVHEDITYEDVYQSDDNLWNFLFFTGYMKKVSERQYGGDIYVTMRISNREVRSIYRNQISSWFDKVVERADRKELYAAILKRDAGKIGKILTGLLRQSISTFDSDESFYHGFLISLLTGMEDYVARFNRESGDGRPDIILYPENPTDPAYLFECKVRKKFNEMQGGLEEAFAQIRTKRYEEGILEDGYAGVVSYGVCFCKKSCIVGVHL